MPVLNIILVVAMSMVTAQKKIKKRLTNGIKKQLSKVMPVLKKNLIIGKEQGDVNLW